MKLRVTQDYAGMTPVGDYVQYREGDILDVDDGFGEWLKRDAPAFEHADPEAAATAPTPEGLQPVSASAVVEAMTEALAADGLDEQTRPTLLGIVAAERVEGVNSRSVKDDLIAAIRAQRVIDATPVQSVEVISTREPIDPVLVGYDGDGEALYVTAWINTGDEEGSVHLDTDDVSEAHADALGSMRVDTAGLETVEVLDADGDEFLVLQGGEGEGYTIAIERPSEDTLRSWLTAAGVNTELLEGLDRAELVENIRDLGTE